jgi:DNA-directed RNA polymerase subunit H (RpoH/RPB5)
MKLVRKHFQITEEQMKKIKEELKRRPERIPKWSESDIVREALDKYLERKGKK